MKHNRNQTVKALKSGIADSNYRTFLWELKSPTRVNTNRLSLRDFYLYVKKIGRPKNYPFHNIHLTLDQVNRFAITHNPPSPAMLQILTETHDLSSIFPVSDIEKYKSDKYPYLFYKDKLTSIPE